MSIPRLTGRGAGSLLLAAAELRALELAARRRRASVWAETAHLVGDPAAPALLASRGYTMLRTYHRMMIDLDGESRRGRGPAASSCDRSTPIVTAGS